MVRRSDEVPALPPTEFVQTLEKGLNVIRCFGEQHASRTLAEVASAVGLSRAAARRLVLTLEALGYVERHGKNFRLRPQILELGYSYLSSQPWWRHGQEVINKLGRELGCACAIGVLDRDHVAYLAYAPGGETPQVVRSIGTRLPAVATAMGRVLLAFEDESSVAAMLKAHDLPRLTPFTTVKTEDFLRELKRAREQDYVWVWQQLEMGLFSVGVPLRDRGGRVFAAMSASRWGSPPDQKRMGRQFLTPMRRAAEAIRSGLPT